MIFALFAFLGAILFIALSVYKALTYAKMPMHGRMELYPVPLEKGRHEYGGSYMEELEWWRKSRKISRFTEIIEMFKEMLFIKKLFQNQRPLWWASYAFHLGIYFLLGWTLLLLAGAITTLAGSAVAMHASLWTAFLYYLTICVGIVGFALATAGACLLIVRRFSDSVLKKYTTPQEYFNLFLILGVLISGIIVWIQDLSFEAARQAITAMLTFSFNPTPALAVHIVLLSAMLTYIPLSKMSHYVGKYFSFHKVLWENEPNVPGSHIANRVKNALKYKPTIKWAAPHMKPNPNPA